ncbi:MAG: amidohydrolase [Deltaproteobacteria bacterium]|nr:amidohydrolase [Deltaproteobacteria bacterium]MBW2353745.1 amidohydrolase [Deltaproteobacteria bacterium]HDZ89591.1 amidohydrolase [Deltaproteobacteria bacterium]
MVEQYDIVIKNGTILTMDRENSVFEDGQVWVRGDALAMVGIPDHEPVRTRKVLDARGGLILPGLVNGHTHAAMSLFRGLADDLPLMEWLNNYIFPAEGRMDTDFVHAGTLLACAEMILSGTTTFCDMYLFEDQVARAASLSGMRCLVGEVLYDFNSPNYGEIEKGFEYAESLILKWKGHPLVSIAVEPHSLFTCRPSLLRRANNMALKYNVPVVIHVAETLSEVDQIKESYGRRPVEHLNSLGILGPHLIIDHAVHLSQAEMELLAHHRVKVIHNPESNMKLASGIAPIPDLMGLGVTVGIGTDGCASNNNLDLFAEMDIAAKLHKVKTMDPAIMDALTVLRMATAEGARALGMGRMIGSLEPGKRADVIVVDTHKPHLTPMYNPYSHLVYSARGNDVIHSIINGRLVMEDRRLLTLDLKDVLKRAREKASAVRRWVLDR